MSIGVYNVYNLFVNVDTQVTKKTINHYLSIEYSSLGVKCDALLNDL